MSPAAKKAADDPKAADTKDEPTNGNGNGGTDPGNGGGGDEGANPPTDNIEDANAAGYLGAVADQTPNEAYTVAGQLESMPDKAETPKTDESTAGPAAPKGGSS